MKKGFIITKEAGEFNYNDYNRFRGILPFKKDGSRLSFTVESEFNGETDNITVIAGNNDSDEPKVEIVITILDEEDIEVANSSLESKLSSEESAIKEFNNLISLIKDSISNNSNLYRDLLIALDDYSILSF